MTKRKTVIYPFIVCDIVSQTKCSLEIARETAVDIWFDAVRLARMTGRRIIREAANSVTVYDAAYHA